MALPRCRAVIFMMCLVRVATLHVPARRDAKSQKNIEVKAAPAFESLGDGACRRNDDSRDGSDGAGGTQQECETQASNANADAYAYSETGGDCYIYTSGPYTKTTVVDYKGNNDWACFVKSTPAPTPVPTQIFGSLGDGACRRQDGSKQGYDGSAGDYEACVAECNNAVCAAYAYSEMGGDCFIYTDGPYTTTTHSDWKGNSDWQCYAVGTPAPTPVPTQLFGYVGTGGCRRDDNTRTGSDGRDGTAEECRDQCNLEGCVAYAHSLTGRNCFIYTDGPYTTTASSDWKGNSDWQCYGTCVNPIDSRETCKAAAVANGLKWDGTRKWADRLPGCLRTIGDTDINWNLDDAGVGLNAGQVQVCG